ncbi:hypothetical protein [Moritella sp. F3]|uniref:hypothetical protein n=1 Tax=Moritella sp. F3 TaxID=2718882 RepID=UPI0018E15987|nr:hypothetical protein [Moritella sp. F3]GIC77060.1 hypothetical protein FMO001_17870 [Moritella sp. F1]GIC82179.1 hypothetical protein FMO003_24600 [Moritella sp. F3]
MSDSTFSRLSRLTLQKNDPFYDLVMTEYNKHAVKQPLMREAMIFYSIIMNKLPHLKLYLDKQIAINKVDTIDEEKFYQWLLLMRRADEILDGHGDVTISHGNETVTEQVLVTTKPEQVLVTTKPEQVQVTTKPDQVMSNKVVKSLGRDTFSSLVANANK